MLISPKYGMRSDVWLRSWQHSFFALTTWGWRDLDQEEGCLPEGEQQQPQDVKEVWFAGDHSDVGGGHKDAIGLAKISLKWMLNEAASCGLRVEKDQYCKMFKDLSSDQCKRHDQTRKWMWRLLELSPRWDLKNCPLPPRREWTWQPAGPRKISESRRNRDVLHESVKVFYADEEKGKGTPLGGSQDRIHSNCRACGHGKRGQV